ncbi:MAG: ABC transporter substrate-binding protein [Pseudomonadota bacterium]
MRKTTFLGAAFAAAALASLPALAQDAKVGFVMSFSGWFQPIDASTINGARLAVKEINSAGGLLDQQIEILEFDNKSEPSLGADGALSVIDQGAKAIMFPSDFDFGAPGAFVAQQNGVISLSGASDPKFGVQGIGPYAYSMSNASQSQGAMLAEWAFEDQGWTTAYVLLDNTIAYTKSLCGAFEQRFKELGGETAVLGSDVFLNGDASIAAQVTRISGLEEKPQVMMFCSYAPGGPSALRQIRAAGLDMPIVSGESMDGDYWIGTVPDLSEFYVSQYGSFYGDDPEQRINDFFARYEEEYGARADASYALRGYSMIEAWARAVERAGTFDAEAVAAEMNAFQDEPLMIGPTTFTPELHISTTRPMTIIKATDGKFSAVGKFSPSEFNLN